MDNAKNFAKATVSTGYDAAATSIDLSSGGGARFPTPPFNATWWDSTTYPDPADDPNREIVRVTGIASDTLTITRAQEGTSASTKNTVGKTYKLLAGFTQLTWEEIMNSLTSHGDGAPSGSTKGLIYIDDLNRDVYLKVSGTFELWSDLI